METQLTFGKSEEKDDSCSSENALSHSMSFEEIDVSQSSISQTFRQQALSLT